MKYVVKAEDVGGGRSTVVCETINEIGQTVVTLLQSGRFPFITVELLKEFDEHA